MKSANSTQSPVWVMLLFIKIGSEQAYISITKLGTSNTPGIQKHVTMLNTRNGTKVYIGMIQG